LFGHHKGAFTDAHTDGPGLFDKAHQGTLFLDEVDALSPGEQVKLLRVLESGEYLPVGSSTVKRADVRIIAATNCDLVAMVEANTFRDDLFYRLHVFEILVPPLRERKEDLSLLIEHFLERFAQRDIQRVLPQDIFDRLLAYQWPGNVRELQNVLCRYVTTRHLNFASRRDVMSGESHTIEGIDGDSLHKAMEAFEQYWILTRLKQHHGHRANTAFALGIPERTLYRKLKKYRID
jgi:transcriptional regulator with PAS, ATPase and Fis domain